MDDYKVLEKVAASKDFDLDQLINMYIAESSGDSDAVNPLGYTGGFQFGMKTGREYGLVGEGFDYRKDLEKSAHAAIEMFRDQTKPMSTKVDSFIKKRDMGSGLVGYLTHQQGRFGFQDIITGAESGNIEDSTRINMLANVGDNDWSNLSDKELADNFLKFWKKRYSDKVEEAGRWTEKYKNIADRDLLNPDEAVMDAILKEAR
jgi:hypothetical protein